MDIEHIREGIKECLKGWSPSRILIGKVIVVLFLLGVVATLMQFSSSSSSLRVTTGTVVDEQGVPIDGAAIVGADDAIVTLPDGSFSIQADTRETLIVSASGYSSVHVPTDYGFPIQLIKQPNSSVRVAVIGPDNKPLSEALVIRLDANTSAPVGEGITDAGGEVLFEDIPSGRAMFVILYPGFGMGWVATAVAPEEYARVAVRLEPFTDEAVVAQARPKLPSLAQIVYAQGDPRAVGSVSFDESEVTKLSDTQFQIIGRVRTVVTAGYDRNSLNAYIEQQKRKGVSPGVGMNVSEAVDELLGPERVKSPLVTTRVLKESDGNIFTITWGMGGKHNVVRERTQSVIVEVRPSTTMEVMGYLKQEYAINHAAESGAQNTVVATSWAEAGVAELAGRKVVLDVSSHRSVCCLAPSAVVVAMAEKSGKAMESGDTVGSTASSISATPATLKTADNEREQFFFRSVRREYSPDENAISNLRKENPSLTFKDQKTGQEISLMNIPAPYPDDAPSEFVLDYLGKGVSAPDMFFDNREKYNEKWRDYLYTTAHTMIAKEGMSPVVFHDDLLTLMDRSMTQREIRTMNVAKRAEIKRENDRMRESFLNQPKVEATDDSQGQSRTNWSDPLQVDRSSAEAPVPDAKEIKSIEQVSEMEKQSKSNQCFLRYLHGVLNTTEDMGDPVAAEAMEAKWKKICAQEQEKTVSYPAKASDSAVPDSVPSTQSSGVKTGGCGGGSSEGSGSGGSSNGPSATCSR